MAACSKRRRNEDGTSELCRHTNRQKISGLLSSQNNLTSSSMSGLFVAPTTITVAEELLLRPS